MQTLVAVAVAAAIAIVAAHVELVASLASAAVAKGARSRAAFAQQRRQLVASTKDSDTRAHAQFISAHTSGVGRQRDAHGDDKQPLQDADRHRERRPNCERKRAPTPLFILERARCSRRSR